MIAARATHTARRACGVLVRCSADRSSVASSTPAPTYAGGVHVQIPGLSPDLVPYDEAWRSQRLVQAAVVAGARPAG